MAKQFYHVNSDVFEKKKTFCVEVPSKEIFHDFIKTTLISPQLELMIKIGISTCSKSDQFKKQFGRDLSELRLKSELFHITAIVFDENLTFLTLSSNDLKINLQFRMHKNSPNVYLIYAE